MKNFNSFIEEAASKRCPEGEYWCHTDKKCKKIPKGKSVGPGGWLRSGHAYHQGHGNGNGYHNGNGNGNGNGGYGNGGSGNGGGGNGGGE